ncbi:MAG: ligase-associated DNA damage response endonuclease PdeM [Devosia sp.]|uniref:ligase-associated DNA damage response endonuclease PdeM n=1 Tax=Devosia sp. 66-22 TaxID=1895753 RepID=UPI000ACCA54C|nr:ligase-associated DNA damage response endonuclease PdeM [Devosia sp. 66-22]MBN9348367.1 ligase-associated DNA damage response endonuclease PdeM [Devosia sp.]
MLLQFAGHTFEPLLSGALFWRAESMLLVADLHFAKFSSYARRGHMLPPYDTGLTLKRLERDIEQTKAERVVALGDSFHRDEGAETLLDTDRLRLLALLGKSHWTWISGNHDPSPHALGGVCVSGLEHRGLTLTHEPRRGSLGMVAGHLHPAATVYSNGSATRRPCFVHDTKILLLPAYGSGAGSMNILGPTFAGLFDHRTLEVTMLGRNRLYPVSTKRLVAGI